MTSNTRRIQMRSKPIETLESRRMLAAFDTPWPEPRDLAISLPSDDVEIGTDSNNLNATLDALAERQTWEELVLRAYQTWSVHADINVGLRNDHDLRFGTPGLLSGDPRFGEFRIGAFPQSGLVASSIPFQAIAGTHSGDLLINSNENYAVHTWQDATGPDPATIVEDQRDFFSVLLHEAGNTLGLEDSFSPLSVMFRQYTTPKGLLTQEDISRIQSLYGQRSDPYENADNGQIQSATLVSLPTEIDIENEVYRVRGSLLDGDDVDVYKMTPITNTNRVVIRVQATGVSLLESRLDILDAAGNIVSSNSAESIFENDNEIVVDNLESFSELYVQVSAKDSNDIYAIGDYYLEVDYRSAQVQASDPDPIRYDSSIDAVIEGLTLVDDEVGSNDTIPTHSLVTASVYDETTRYDFVSSVADVTDVDVWKITAPPTASDQLYVHIGGVGGDLSTMRIRIMDSNGRNVGASGRLRENGTWSLVVNEPIAAMDYYIRLSVDANSEVGNGNYVVSAEFVAPSTQMNSLVSGDVEQGHDDFFHWTAAKSRLYRFDLNTVSEVDGVRVRLTIYDAHTRERSVEFTALEGHTRTAFAWLAQGDYILHLSYIDVTDDQTPAPQNSSNPVATYIVTADGVSDDQDNNGVDPTEDPDYDSYTYYEYDYEYTYDAGYYDYMYDYLTYEPYYQYYDYEYYEYPYYYYYPYYYESYSYDYYS